MTLAGCVGGGEDREDNAATAGLEAAPWIGTEPAEADELIVAFEDPACSTCRRFHQQEFPALRDRVEEGSSRSLVYRPYPVVASWSWAAGRAIHATTDRDREAAWALIDWYYQEQGRFYDEPVTEPTATFLDQETDVDGQAVADDVTDNRFQGQLESTVDDGSEAGADTTPTFVLFSGESHVTRLTGVQDADVFITALEDA